MRNQITVTAVVVCLMFGACSNGPSLEELQETATRQQAGTSNGVRATDPIDFEATTAAQATPTPVPPLDSGYAREIDPVAVGEFQPLATALVDHGLHVVVTGYAEPQQIAPNLGDSERQAWPGERLIAVRIEMESWPRAYSDDEGTQLNIKIGDEIVTRIAPRDGEMTVLASVPDASTPIIELTTTIGDRVIAQQVDPATGDTRGEPFGVWTRTPEQRVATVNERWELGFEVIDDKDWFDYGTFPTELTVTNAVLRHRVVIERRAAPDITIEASNSNTALLWLSAVGSGGNTWRGPLTRPEQAILTLADGTEIGANYMNLDNDDNLKPGTLNHTGLGTAQLDYRTASATFEITFG